MKSLLLILQKAKDNLRDFSRRVSFKKTSPLVILGVLLGAAIALFPATYETEGLLSVVPFVGEREESVPSPVKVTHIRTPDAVKAIYMTSWVASTPKWRAELARLVENTELNAIVIDAKDYSGRISFAAEDPYLKEIGVSDVRIPDIKEFLAALHEKDIYTIARITVFQDPFFAKKRPDLAVQKESDKSLWADYKGLHYIDPGALEAWDYTIRIAKESYAAGFDELNFDYIRFPSDGPMKDIFFPFSEARVVADPNLGKAKVMRDFFAYLHAELAGSGAVLSADLFGMTTTNADDLNIGQTLEYAAPYFDYLAPMVYPSHYPTGFIGYANPVEYPYEVVKYSMDRGVLKLTAAGIVSEKLRPWLQDFDYKADYGATEVRAQMQAVYDAGLTSWMLWDPANRYTRDALADE